MFFRSWRKKRALAQRDIFQFWDFQDGKRVHRAIDPMEAYDAMWHGDHGCIPKEDFPLIEECDIDDDGNLVLIKISSEDMRLEQKEAQERAMNMIGQMFGVHGYDHETQSGLTVNERIDLLANFQWYMGLLKKKRLPQPTQSAPTDQESSGQKNSATNSESDSS